MIAYDVPGYEPQTFKTPNPLAVRFAQAGASKQELGKISQLESQLPEAISELIGEINIDVLRSKGSNGLTVIDQLLKLTRPVNSNQFTSVAEDPMAMLLGASFAHDHRHLMNNLLSHLSLDDINQMLRTPCEGKYSIKIPSRAIIPHVIEVSRNDLELRRNDLRQELDQAENLRNVEICEMIISSLVNTGQSRQDQHGTCGPESINLLVKILEPGRWAEMAINLFQNGSHDNLVVTDNINKPDISENREQIDRVIQAVIKSACPPIPGATYDNQLDVFFGPNGANLGNGIYTRSAVKIISKLLNSDFDFTNDKELIAQHIKSSTEPFYASIIFADNPKDANGGHALVVTGIDSDGNVHFRNPWGPNNEASAGDKLTNPPRKMINPATGEESMKFDDFMERLTDAAIPVTKIREIYNTNYSILAKRGLELTRTTSLTEQTDREQYLNIIKNLSADSIMSIRSHILKEVSNDQGHSERSKDLESSRPQDALDRVISTLEISEKPTAGQIAELKKMAIAEGFDGDVALTILQKLTTYDKATHLELLLKSTHPQANFRFLTDPIYGNYACMKGLNVDDSKIRLRSALTLSNHSDPIFKKFGESAFQIGSDPKVKQLKDLNFFKRLLNSWNCWRNC